MHVAFTCALHPAQSPSIKEQLDAAFVRDVVEAGVRVAITHTYTFRSAGVAGASAEELCMHP